LSNDGKAPDLPGTKTLDYLGLGLLLATPAVVVDMYLKGTEIDWRKTAIAAAISWITGGFAVWASHHWQSWRTSDNRVVPLLVAFEGKFFGRAIIIAAAMGFALALSSFLSPPIPAVAPTPTAADITKATAPLKAQLDEAHEQIARLQAAQKNMLSIGAAPEQPPPAAADIPRVYTNKTVQDLAAFYKDRTTMQGNVFMADEIGKWINTEGKLQNLMPDGGGAALYNDSYQILCNFGEKWKAKLAVLRPFDLIKIAGKIRQDQWAPPALFLEECELRD